MRLLSWLRRRVTRQVRNSPRRKSRPPSRFRPRLEALEDRWLPSTLTVLNTNDSGPGSLRAEIAAAQSGDTINFDPSLGPYPFIALTSGELVIDKSMTIEWNNPAGVPFIEGNYGQGIASRVFDVTSKSASVALDNLVFGGMAATGGAIENVGSVTLSGCSVGGIAAGSKSNTKDNVGGAIDNNGTMVINNCNFSFSSAAGNGGAIENEGTMTITNSSFAGNFAVQNGGAIDNQGALTISASSLGDFAESTTFNNVAEFGSGGGVSNFGTLYVTGSTFFGAGAVNGGAIANFGNALVDSSTIVGTTFGETVIAQNGGGIYNIGKMTISNSTISNCIAFGFGGGIYNGGNLTLLQSSVIGNVVDDVDVSEGGGIYNTGALYVTNASTVCGNTASAGADLYNLGFVFISSDSDVCVIGP